MNKEKQEKGMMVCASTRLCRQEIVKRMIDLKTEDDAQNLGAWKWLLDLLDHLEEDGMSSEESDIDTWTGMEVYYIKEMMWCRDVQHGMTLIDNKCYKENQ